MQTKNALITHGLHTAWENFSRLSKLGRGWGEEEGKSGKDRGGRGRPEPGGEDEAGPVGGAGGAAEAGHTP